MTAVATLAIIFSFVAGATGGVIAVLSLAIARQDRRSERARAERVRLSTASLFDLTGTSVYSMLRQALAVRKPDKSAIESFHASARTVSDAYDEAVRDIRHLEEKSGTLWCVITPSPEDDPDAVPGQTSSEPDSTDAVDRLPGNQRPVDDEGEVEQIASLVIARIENKLEQHLHTQMEMPSADQAAELREKAPEVYQAWIDIARQKADTESYIQRAQYEVPERLARTGRPWALTTLIIVLGFCAWVASLGGSGIYVAGIIAVLDLATMLGLFFGFRPGLNLESRRAKRQLPPADSSGDSN